MGFVYMNGIWGGHAWVEAHIDGRWIPLDSAVNQPGVAGAARIKFMTTSLNDGGNTLSGEAGVQMFGNVRIKVLSYTLDGRKIDAPDSGRPYSIADGTYVNPGVGLRIEPIDGFEFTGLTDVFPKSSLVTLQRGKDEKIVVHQLLLAPGRDATKSVWKHLGRIGGLDHRKTQNRNHRSIFEHGDHTIHRLAPYETADANTIVIGIRRQSELWVIHIDSENAGSLENRIMSALHFSWSGN